mmetsp:Transcript_36591/g.59153  ORF Transcript_36591/g.59153 Transcript_36591/m.59153 type:complete len:1025 (+) Transcript_36591:45-3119(+)
MEILCAALQNTLSNSESERHAAEELLRQLEGSPGYIQCVLGVITTENVDATVRQAGSIYFKNFIFRDWVPKENNQRNKFSDEEKAIVRDNIVEALIFAHPQTRMHIAQALRNIAQHDFPEQWPNLLQQIFNNLSSNTPVRLYGSLLALRVLAKQYEFKKQDIRGPLEKMVESTFPVLLQLFTYLLQIVSIESVDMQKIICKIFWSSTQLALPPYMLRPGMLAEWMACFKNVLDQRAPVDGRPPDPSSLAAHWPGWKTKKWVGHIVHRLFLRFGNSKLVQDGKPDAPLLKAFAHTYLHEWSIPILESCFGIVDLPQRGEFVPPRILNLCISYIDVSVSHSLTYRQIRPHLEVLLFGVVFPLLCYDKSDEILWAEDPNEYVRKAHDILEDYYSPRAAATNLLLTLGKHRAKSCLTLIVGFLSRILTTYNGLPLEQRDLRQKYGAMSIAGHLCHLLSRRPAYSGTLENMLLFHVVPEFDSPVGLLRAMACRVVGQFAEQLEFAMPNTFNVLLESVLRAMRDTDIPVRIEAAVAVRMLLDNKSATLERMQPFIPPLLDELFKLMDEIDNEDLVFTLENLIEKYSEVMAPYAVMLCTKLTQSCLRMVDADEEDEESGMAALGCLRAINIILQCVHNVPTIYLNLETILLPLLRRMLCYDAFDYIEEALEILTYVTFFSPAISPQLWSLVPHIFQAFDEWAFDYMEQMLRPLDNFISRDTDTFVNGTPERSYVDLVYRMCKKVLERSDPGDIAGWEMQCRHACKLIEAVFQNCKGRVDGWVPQFLDLVLETLPKTRGMALKRMLLEVVADGLYYNPLICIAHLEARRVTAEVFFAWIHLRDKFPTQYDKKVVILGLTSLLAVPVSNLPPSVLQFLPQILDAALKLLVDLQQQREGEDKKEAEGGEGEDEEADEAEEEEEDEEKDVDSDQDLDNEEDAKYVWSLEDRERHIASSGGDDDGDGEEVEEDEEFTSPIHDLDEVIFFAETFHTLQSQQANYPWTCSLTEDQHRKLQDTFTVASARKRKAESESS